MFPLKLYILKVYSPLTWIFLLVLAIMKILFSVFLFFFCTFCLLLPSERGHTCLAGHNENVVDSNSSGVTLVVLGPHGRLENNPKVLATRQRQTGAVPLTRYTGARMFLPNSKNCGLRYSRKAL